MARSITFFFNVLLLFFPSLFAYKRSFYNTHIWGKNMNQNVGEELVITPTQKKNGTKKQKTLSGCYPHATAEYDQETKARILNDLEINYEKQQLLLYLLDANRNSIEGTMKALEYLDRNAGNADHKYTVSLESGGLYSDYNFDFE